MLPAFEGKVRVFLTKGVIMFSERFLYVRWMWLMFLATSAVFAQVSAHLYGIHDHNVGEQEFLNHLNNGNVKGWVTATVEVGDDPNNPAGADFRNISSQGHTVICRINRGYGATGTIPPPALYDNFAQRCAKFVAATQGCQLFSCH